MTAIRMTLKLANAAAQDAANRTMRAANRTAWNEDDWNMAAATYIRLLALIDRAEGIE